MKTILSVIVRNQPGILMRVAGMFSRRGFNIDSLAVGMTNDNKYSRMTVAVEEDNSTIEQIIKQLEKLIEVEDVKILPENTKVSRGMALVKVRSKENRMELLKLAEVFRVNVIDINEIAIIFEITGAYSKIRAFIDVMNPYGILEMVQTGIVALERGGNYMSAGKQSKFVWPESNDLMDCKII